MTWAPRPIPDDFAQHIHEPFDALRKRYSAGTVSVSRWIEECGVARRKMHGGRRTPPLPADYAEKGRALPLTELVTLYGVGRFALRRWDKQCGITRRRFGDQARAAKPKPAPASKKHRGLMMIAVTRDARDYSQAGQAADFLRRFGPVVRCDEKGRYKADGQHWRRGSTILTADEVIARAERNGWNPDSWRQVA